MEVVPGLHWVERIWDTKVYVLFEGDRLVVIDAAMPGRAEAVWRYLGALGHSPEAVDEIWLTHGDIDHMGSVAALKTGSGAKVVAHRADAALIAGQAERRLDGQGVGTLGPSPLVKTFEGVFNWAIRRMLRYRPIPVDHLVEDGDDLGGWQVVHVPGHTPGSVSFYHPTRKIIVVGDALNYRKGRLGAPPPLFSYDMAQAYTSIQKIAALDFEVCCFGHGPPLFKDATQRVRAFADSLQPAGE